MLGPNGLEKDDEVWFLWWRVRGWVLDYILGFSAAAVSTGLLVDYSYGMLNAEQAVTPGTLVALLVYVAGYGLILRAARAGPDDELEYV